MTRSVRRRRRLTPMLLAIVLVGLGCKKVIQPAPPTQEKITFAASIAQADPFTALNTLGTLEDSTLQKQKDSLLFRLLLDQREYRKAARLADSLRLRVEPETLAAISARAGLFDKAARLTRDHLVRGIHFMYAEEFDSAINCLKTAPHALEDYRRYYLGKALYNQDRLREAEENLSLVITIPPYREQDYYELLARCLVQSGQVVRAREVVEQIKDAALRTFLQGKLADLAGDPAAARKLYWQAVERYPGSAVAYSLLDILTPKSGREFRSVAQVFYERGDYRKATLYLNRAGKVSGSYYLRGMICYRTARYDSAAYYLMRSQSPQAYYWLGRIYEILRQDSSAIAAYDTSLAHATESSLRRRLLTRKGHLLEEHDAYIEACSTFLAIALQYPSERRRSLFRSGLLCYRAGQVTKAKEFFSQDTAPEFLYWQMRMNERLGLPIDSLRMELQQRHPLSYYTMIKEKANRFYDTLPLKPWLAAVGDTIPVITVKDSVALDRALFFLNHGLDEIGFREMRSIKTANPALLYRLACIAQANGLDHEAIRLGFALRRLAESAGVRRMTKDLLPIMYPVRYAASINRAGLEPALVLAVIRQESSFNPRARSPADAIGLMQIIPHTGRLLARDFKLTSYDLFDPEISILFGMKYLEDQLAVYNSLPLALAAYNGGPVNVNKWLAKDPAVEMDEFIELIPFDETREYVKNVLLQKEIYAQLLNSGDFP